MTAVTQDHQAETTANTLTVPAAILAFLHPDPARFTSEPDSGIVLDPLTGLMWAQRETDRLDWDTAHAACRASTLGGFDDWRMPTREELLTILDLGKYNPCLPAIFDTHSGDVWTATQAPWSLDEAGASRSFFCVDMDDGYVSDHRADYLELRARPVRRAWPASQ